MLTNNKVSFHSVKQVNFHLAQLKRKKISKREPSIKATRSPHRLWKCNSGLIVFLTCFCYSRLFIKNLAFKNVVHCVVYSAGVGTFAWQNRPKITYGLMVECLFSLLFVKLNENKRIWEEDEEILKARHWTRVPHKNFSQLNVTLQQHSMWKKMSSDSQINFLMDKLII